MDFRLRPGLAVVRKVLFPELPLGGVADAVMLAGGETVEGWFGGKRVEGV